MGQLYLSKAKFILFVQPKINNMPQRVSQSVQHATPSIFRYSLQRKNFTKETLMGKMEEKPLVG